MSDTLIFAAIGCLGGLSKSFIGLLKAKTRGEKIRFGYIVRTLKFSVISGTIIGASIGYSISVSFLAGYIGSDILEEIYFLFKKTKIWKKHFNKLRK